MSVYNIKVLNPNKKCTGVSRVLLNDEIIESKKVKLNSTGGVYNIKVIM